jgi:NADH-quinone oxidoreductase subunit L
MLFLAFHGEERFRHADAAQADHDVASRAHDERGHVAEVHEEPGHAEHAHDLTPHESPWVITVPLVLLAIPSLYSGWAHIDKVLFGNYFGSSIAIAAEHGGLATMREEWHGTVPFMVHGLLGLPLWLALAGIATAWLFYIRQPDLPAKLRANAGGLYALLINNYYIDRFNDWLLAGGFRRIGSLFSNVGDRSIIDGFFVNGSARLVGATSALLRKVQSGYVYHYAFTMIIGVFALLTWWVGR